MNRKRSTYLILIIVGILMVLILCTSFFNGRIHKVPSGSIGNSAGNLMNNGLFCEYNGQVYFSNAYDNGALYVMNPDETNMKKLSSSNVRFINAAGDYLVYYMESGKGGSGLGYVRSTYGIFRTNLKGKEAVCLSRNPATMVKIIDNSVYYQNYDVNTNSTLRKMDLSKKNDKEVLDFAANPASCENGIIYYSGIQKDHYLYTLDTTSDVSSKLWNGNIYNPIKDGDYIYYMDVANDYCLCRYSFSNDKIDILTHDRIDFFNLYKDMIYYQKSSTKEPALKRMYTDGSNVETVASGVYNNINITSQYVYFSTFDEPIPFYRTSTSGPINVTTFDSALQAATSNEK